MILPALKLLTEFVTVTLYTLIGYVSRRNVYKPSSTRYPEFFLLPFSIPD
jgi:hypothetical protein